MAEPIEIVAAIEAQFAPAPPALAGRKVSSPPARRMSRSIPYAISATIHPASRAMRSLKPPWRLAPRRSLVSGPVESALAAGRADDAGRDRASHAQDLRRADCPAISPSSPPPSPTGVWRRRRMKRSRRLVAVHRNSISSRTREHPKTIVPVDGDKTISYTEAAKIVARVEPAIVIPMCYDSKREKRVWLHF